jgi:hypothetical protein
VIAVAAGNPLYAIELTAVHLTSVTSVEDWLTLPPRLEELLAGRLERLPQGAAEPLAAVAGLAAPTVALVVAALGADARAGLASAPDRMAWWSSPPGTRACRPGRRCRPLAGRAPGRHHGVQGLVQGPGRR